MSMQVEPGGFGFLLNTNNLNLLILFGRFGTAVGLWRHCR